MKQRNSGLTSIGLLGIPILLAGKNMRRDEWKALRQLKTDKECMVLTADKGMALVVMVRHEYIKKPGHFWQTPVPIGPFQQIPPLSSRTD